MQLLNILSLEYPSQTHYFSLNHTPMFSPFQAQHMSKWICAMVSSWHLCGLSFAWNCLWRANVYRNKQIWIGCCCDTGSWLIDHIHNHFAVVTCPLYSGKNDWQWHAQDLKPCISRQSQRSWGINCFNLSLETLQSISEPEMCCGQHISRRMTWQPRGYWASPWRWEIHNIKLSCKPDKMISTSEWIKYLELVNNWFTHCPDLVGGKLDCSWA